MDIEKEKRKIKYARSRIIETHREIKKTTGIGRFRYQILAEKYSYITKLVARINRIGHGIEVSRIQAQHKEELRKVIEKAIDIVHSHSKENYKGLGTVYLVASTDLIINDLREQLKKINK